MNANNIYEMIEYAVQAFHGRPAISYKENKVLITKKYEEVYADIQKTAVWLEEHHWTGKKAALVGAMDYEWAIAYLTLLYTGSVIMTMNYTQEVFDLEEELRLLDPDVLLYGKIDDAQQEWAKQLTSVETASMYEAKRTPVPDIVRKYELDPELPACVLFTTGSTGKKKGVMLAQKNMMALCASAEFAYDGVQFDKGMAPVPNYHLMKLGSIISMFSNGIEQYITSNTKRTLKDIHEQKPAFIQAVPLVLEALRNILENDTSEGTIAEKFQKFNGHLHTVSVGGSFSDPKTIDFFEDLGVHIISGYGMTEAVVITNERAGRKKKGSVGEVTPGVHIRIVDGEVQVSGQSVMLGYYKDQAATDEVFEDGWLKTGDLGYVDDEGYLYLTGRKKNLIILANGENVSPEELEGQLRKCPMISEALVKEKDGHLHAEVQAVENAVTVEIDDYIRDMNRKNVLCKRIVSWELRETPFEKINAMKIRRN